MRYEHPSSNPPSQDFNDALTDQLRKTPWFLVSTALHAFVFMLVILLSPDAAIADLPNTMEVAYNEDVPDEPVDDVIPVEPVDVPEVPKVDPVDVPNIDTQDHASDVADFNTFDRDDSDFSDQTGEPSLNPNVIGLGDGNPGGGDGFGRGDGLGGPGGRPPHLKTLRAAFDWLKRHQHAKGSWDGDDFIARAGEPHAKDCQCCRGAGANPLHDVGLTGMAILTYLGAGETHKAGDYRQTVRSGLKWLVDAQDAEGCFGARHQGFTYSHAIASLAMIEAYGMTRSPLFKKPAEKALNFCLSCQVPYGGWRYGEQGADSDTSVTGWMVMALKSAKLAGMKVPQRSLDWAVDWIDQMTDEETGRTGYVMTGAATVREKGKLEEFPGTESEAMTAAGILVRIFAGADPEEDKMIKLGAEQVVVECLPLWDESRGSIDMYYWYYGTLAMFQVGGSSWRSWNRAMVPAIVETQRADGCAAGSWDPKGAWGGVGGRIYATALMALSLEVYYRYPRVFGLK